MSIFRFIFEDKMDTLKTNVLYYGDNLDILHKYIPENSIDLIYLDREQIELSSF